MMFHTLYNLLYFKSVISLDLALIMPSYMLIYCNRIVNVAYRRQLDGVNSDQVIVYK